MVTQEGLFFPRSVLQKVLNATPHFKSMLDTEMVAGLVGVICRVWVDVIVIKERTPGRC